MTDVPLFVMDDEFAGIAQEVAGCDTPEHDVQFASASESDGGGRTCPHVDRNDQRCGHRFSLGRIEQAFSVCFGAFHACPVFHRISSEVENRAAAEVEPPIITVTIRRGNDTISVAERRGRADRSSLRATGT